MSDLSQYNESNALIYTTPEEQIKNSLYQTMNTVINVNKDQFHSIYPNLYPKKELTNQIGAGMGIEFINDSKLDEVYGDLVEYPDGRKVRKVEGYRCTKQGRRRRPDGTWALSSPGIYEFNWINRSELDFLADEEKEAGKQKYTFPTDAVKDKRRKLLHIEELKKFAAQRASTGAELVVIRELTGMSTSFKANDIAKGVIVVSQIVEAQAYQMEKAKATIENIRSGGHIGEQSDHAVELLTGKKSNVQEDIKKTEGKTPEPEPEPEKKVDPPLKPKGLREQFEELEGDAKPLSSPGYADYLDSVEKNKYSDPVLEWAITEIMTRLAENG